MPYHPFRHLGLKFLSICLAVLLWLTVAGEHIVERSLRVPLEFRSVPEQLEIIGDPPATVDVRVRGSSGILSRLEPGEVVGVLDLTGARPGTRMFHLLSAQIKAPFGVEVAHVVPGTITLELERSGAKVVPILPAVVGDPAPGYVVGRVTTVPATVEVIGPESRLRQLRSATTEPLSVEGAAGPVVDTVTVGIVDAALRLKEARSAVVSVEVHAAPVERRLGSVPIRLRNLEPALAAAVEPPHVAVVVRGRREVLGALGPESVDASLDLAGLGPGRYNLPVHVDVRQEVGVSEIDPSAVAVRLSRRAGRRQP
jgi:YbbR domain-containing protein